MADLFEGKNCIVTGASTGIGYGLSKRLLERGAEVWLCSRTPENVEKAQKLFISYGDRAHFDVIDVRDPSQVDSYINSIAEKRPVDYLFNNAGIGFKGRFIETTLEMWEDVLSVNLYGVVHGTYAVLPIMLKQGFGHIINVASVCGIVPLPYQTIYNASKYAVVGFSESLRYELEEKNIRVSVVCPGAVDTMIFRRAMDYSIADIKYAKSPPEAISPEQAADEILAGVEANMGILPITDFARETYENISKNPAANDYAMRDIRRLVEEAYLNQI